MKYNDKTVDANATSFQPIGLNEKVVKSTCLKLNYSCDCFVHEVHELNYTYCRVEKKGPTFLVNGKASLNVADDAAVLGMASMETFVPVNLSGAAANGDVAAGLRESGNLTKPVRKSLFFSFLFFFILQKLRIKFH